MEIIKPFIALGNLIDNIKLNGEACPHLQERLKALEKLVDFLQETMPEELPEDMKEASDKLNEILQSANKLTKKYSEERMMNQMVKVVKASDYKLEFENLNKRITDAFVTLSVALHVHQAQKLEEKEKKLEKQEKKLDEQEKKLDEKVKRLDEQEKKLDEKVKKLTRQEKMLAEQDVRIREQEDILLRVESTLACETKAYYCVLQ